LKIENKKSSSSKAVDPWAASKVEIENHHIGFVNLPSTLYKSKKRKNKLAYGDFIFTWLSIHIPNEKTPTDKKDH